MSSWRAATVLIIDEDAVSRRFVELTLANVPGFLAETARDGASALEILQTTKVDLILSETDLPDTGGLHLYRRLTQERRLRSIPFVFLSSDARLETKVAALQAGVDDYLCKPCPGGELVARLQALIARYARIREIQRQRNYTLAGDFSAIPFTDLVAIIQMGRRTGTLSLATPHPSARCCSKRARSFTPFSATSLGAKPSFV